MRAQFCVYVCALLLAGAHGCTGLFADNVKLTDLFLDGSEQAVLHFYKGD